MSRHLFERVLLAVLALSALVVGSWAQFAPRSFYDSFPGGGRSWVAPDGPFNEHLIRDVGGLNLALAVLTLTALVRLTPVLVRTTAIAWLVYALPHLVYHAMHLDPFDTTDQVAEMVSLAVTVAVPAALLVLDQLGSARDASASSVPAGSRKNAIHSSTPSASNVPS